MWLTRKPMLHSVNMKTRLLCLEIAVIVGAAAALGLFVVPAKIQDGSPPQRSCSSQHGETPPQVPVGITINGVAPGMTRDTVEARFGRPVVARVVAYYGGARFPWCTYSNGTAVIYTSRGVLVHITGNSLELDGKDVGHDKSSAADLRQRLGSPVSEAFGAMWYRNGANILDISSLGSDRVWYTLEREEDDQSSDGSKLNPGKNPGKTLGR